MKYLLLVFTVMLLLPGCKKDQEALSVNCWDLWKLSAGELKEGDGTLKFETLTNEYITRCCELIDGANSEGVSSQEGQCMSDLLVMIPPRFEEKPKKLSKAEIDKLKDLLPVKDKETKTAPPLKKEIPLK